MLSHTQEPWGCKHVDGYDIRANLMVNVLLRWFCLRSWDTVSSKTLMDRP